MINGDLNWGGSRLSPDQWGSIELGGTSTTAGVGTPYIDFHFAGATQDYNARIINDGNGLLSVHALTLRAVGDLRVEGTLNKLDVAEGGTFAYIRAHDLWFGHSSRHGGMGRALVDEGTTLALNYEADWWQGIRYWGSWTRASSRTIKDRITRLSSQRARRIIDALEPVTFVYKSDHSSTLHIGFVAEDTPADVASSDRQAVKVDDILAVLTRVVKDQQGRLAALASRINKVKRVPVPDGPTRSSLVSDRRVRRSR